MNKEMIIGILTISAEKDIIRYYSIDDKEVTIVLTDGKKKTFKIEDIESIKRYVNYN